MLVYEVGQLNITAGDYLDSTVSKYLFVHRINYRHTLLTMYNNGWSHNPSKYSGFKLEFMS